MSDQGTPAGDVEGKRFLYDAPELLTVEAHGALGLSPIEAPYAFAAKAQAVPIAMSEFCRPAPIRSRTGRAGGCGCR